MWTQTKYVPKILIKTKKRCGDTLKTVVYECELSWIHSVLQCEAKPQAKYKVGTWDELADMLLDMLFPPKPIRVFSALSPAPSVYLSLILTHISLFQTILPPPIFSANPHANIFSAKHSTFFSHPLQLPQTLQAAHHLNTLCKDPCLGCIII